DVDDVAVHSEIRDHRAAYICTQRAIELAQRYDHRFHVLHLSTAGELPLLEGGDPLITAEVCPHHLLFNINDYGRLGSLVQMNPSIKTAEDNQGLWKALVDGQIQVVATDHAPHTMAEKQQRYPASPSGLPAVENSLSLMLHRAAAGQCTLSQIVAWMCDAPARVWDIVQKGRIEVGYDADLVLVDLQRQRTIQNENQFTKCGWSPWHGETVMGVPVMTFVGGDMVFRLPADKEVGEINDRVRGRKPLFDHARGGYWATPDGIGLR
ncbi:MAG: amidohydrolase family protein, partial [Planctomycetota bacterium]